MPIYEFRCRTCGSRFEELRPMADVGSSVATAVSCPQGHEDVERLLSVIAPSSSQAPTATSSGGACCASGCACGAN